MVDGTGAGFAARFPNTRNGSYPTRWTAAAGESYRGASELADITSHCVA